MTEGRSIQRSDALPIALLVALAILVATSIPLLSPDSFFYTDTARQLGEGRGPVTWALHLGMPAVPSPSGFWPVLYPNALRLAEAAAVPAERAPAAVNAVALVALCLALVRIGRRCLPRAWAWPVALLAVAHPFYADVLAFAWSEALFMAFAYAALAVVVGRAGDERDGEGSLRPWRCAVAGALAGAAFATRYAGIFLLGYLLAACAIAALRRTWRPARAAAAAASVLCAFAVVALPAVVPNLRTYGSVFGMPRLAQPSVARGALERGRELVTTGAVLWLWAAGLVAAVAVTLAARPADAPPERRSPAATWLLAGWIAFYGCALFVSLAPYARSDPLDGRFLAPIAPAAVVLLASWLTRGRVASRAAVAAASLLAVGAFVRVGWVHRSDLPAADPVATWSMSHARDDSLFVGRELWELPHWAGAAVLTDGYPEMPALAPDRVRDFLRAQGARFRTVHLVYGGTAGLKAAVAPAYERAMRAIGFRARGADRLADGSIIVTLAR